MKKPIGLFLLLFLLVSSKVDAATFRIALIVGNNEGNPGRVPLRYAEQDARNLARTLLQIGDFPENQIHLLLGRSSTSLREEMKEIRAQALRLAKEPRDRLLLLFYFSGHSEGGFLEMGGSQMQFRALREELRQVSGSTRLLILDTCHSGHLIRTKGGVPVPPFALDPSGGGELPQGEILLASSTELEESQESSEIGGSFFTHHFVSGIRGAADFNHDGRVSLQEAWSYANERTLKTTARLQRTQHPSFEFNLSGEGEIYLSRLQEQAPLLSLAPSEAGHFLIFDRKARILVADLEKKSGEPLYVAIPEGEVSIRKRKQDHDLEQVLKASKGGLYHFREELGQQVQITSSRRILSYSLSSGGKGLLLREGEVIRLKLSETLSTKTSHAGDKVRMVAAEDLYVDGGLVISRGATATGEVLAIRQRRGIVHGELACRIGYVQAVDGQWIPLESIVSKSPEGLRQVKEGEEPVLNTGSRTETDVASTMTTLFFLPLYPFIRGRHAVFEEGTLFEAYVARDVTIR